MVHGKAPCFCPLNLPGATKLEEHANAMARSVCSGSSVGFSIGEYKANLLIRLTVLTGVIRLNGITVQMSCPEYLRLRQHYDAALRRWAQIELSSHRPGLIDASARLAEEVRQKALDERNEANERMRLHEQNCPTCHPRRKPVADRTSVTASV